MGNRFDGWSSIPIDSGVKNYFSCDSTDDNLCQIDGLREFLRNRDEALKMLDKAEREKLKLLEEKQKVSSGQSSRMSFFT